MIEMLEEGNSVNVFFKTEGTFQNLLNFKSKLTFVNYLWYYVGLNSIPYGM